MELFTRNLTTHLERPNLAWQTAAPASEGMGADALDLIRRGLERRGTGALPVVRGGRILYDRKRL